MSHDLKAIASQFQIDGRFANAHPIESGHINETYAATFHTPRGEQRFIHQRINHHVFKQPELVMENIERVTAYARQRITAAGGDPARQVLTLVPALDGKSYIRTPDGSYWRTYYYIEGARSYDHMQDLRLAYNAARAFGGFQNLLADLPGGRLHETIPNFHHTPSRFTAFVQAVESDAAHRRATAPAEIDFILARQADTAVVVDLIAAGLIPERVTHNDTKLNNVLIDDATGEGLCVIDLDTIMPGSVLYDFGDLVRMGAATAVEDEPDPAKVGLDLARFEQLARGYLASAASLLAPAEWQHLAFAGKLITLEQGMRFLADYLNGDSYYRIHYPDHNLVRARTQLKLVAAMEAQMGEMQRIVEELRA